jgi:hypothetical protein
MTKHELAIIMAYTGISTLTGEDFNIFHKYVEDLMGRPVYTHEFASRFIENELKERSKPDFIRLCQTATEDDAK